MTTTPPERPNLGPVLSAVTDYGDARYAEGKGDGRIQGASDRQAEIDALTGDVAKYVSRVADMTTLIADLQRRLATHEKHRITVGGTTGSNGDPTPLETKAGAIYGNRRTFWSSSAKHTASSIATAKADLAQGRVPLLSYKVGDWAAVVAGGHDTWATKLAADLAALGGTIRVAIHHEPEGDGDIATWTRMQERLAPIFAAAGIEFWICLTGWHELYGEAKYNFDALWPNTPHVTGFAVDVYQSDAKTNGAITDLDAAYWAKLEAEAKKRGVKWSIWETGVSDATFAADPEWFTRNIAAAASRGAVDFGYFNTTLNSANTWRAVTGSPKEAAFLKAVTAARA